MSWLQRRRRQLRRLNLRPQPASLSSKVLWITVVALLAMELLALLPGLGRERQEWLWQRVSDAHLAVFALSQGSSPGAADRVLRFAGLQEITLTAPHRAAIIWRIDSPLPAAPIRVEPAQQSLLASSWHACLRLAGYGPPEELIVTPSPLMPGGILEVRVDAAPLTLLLSDYAKNGFDLAMVVALLAGLLVYGLLNWMLVRPMEILTTSIIHFREAPERAQNSGLDWLANRPKDDISSAARELQTMQEELRAALWRNARLAAVGTAVAKIAHDLRNILSSTLLVADRLQDVDDPLVKRATRTLIPSVERATQLVTSTVDFAREGRTQLNRSPVRVRALIDEVAETLLPENAGWRIENLTPDELELPLDRAQLYRVFANLIRNAAEAGATLISLSTETMNGKTRLRVADNGPGLPERAKANLFKPFTSSVRSGGTGLGLTIARDLIRAHGGDLVLERTGPAGTVFCMDLAAHELQAM
ncbi:MAG TPA: HAMP domain-containing sensor histidine kinase [Acidocella sp.]|nr:HAMP domain-containing sensor histidine kinase [Acidocella sp.]